jgi:hypothetical protein
MSVDLCVCLSSLSASLSVLTLWAKVVQCFLFSVFTNVEGTSLLQCDTVLLGK